jgi:phosphatidate cytidylyltransferase
MVPVVLMGAVIGGWVFAVLVAGVAVVVALEWGALVARRHGLPRLRLWAALPAAGAAIAGVAFARTGDAALALAAIAVAAAIAGACGRGHHWPTRWLVLGVAYVALTPTLLVWMRDREPDGLVYVLFLFAVVWAADSFAYFAGRLLGGPRLAPVWSPNKTWAGLLGATAGAGAAGAVVALAFGLPFVGGAAVLGALLGLLAQAGDLFESRFKRLAHTKDTSLLIPGHGGALDRLDALMFATPAFAGFVALHP